VLAAADVLIQAASGATPSLSPPPRHARRPSASGHENANITSLLQAAAQIDHTRPASESDGASGRGRPTSPLFVPQGSPPHDFPALDMTPEPATPEDTAGEMPDDGRLKPSDRLTSLSLSSSSSNRRYRQPAREVLQLKKRLEMGGSHVRTGASLSSNVMGWKRYRLRSACGSCIRGRSWSKIAREE